MQGKCGLRRYLTWQTLRLSHYLLSLGTQNTNPLVLAGWAVGIRGPGFRWHFFLFFYGNLGDYRFDMLLLVLFADPCLHFSRKHLENKKPVLETQQICCVLIYRFFPFSLSHSVSWFPVGVTVKTLSFLQLMRASNFFASIGLHLTNFLLCSFIKRHYSVSLVLIFSLFQAFWFQLIHVNKPCPSCDLFLLLILTFLG